MQINSAEIKDIFSGTTTALISVSAVISSVKRMIKLAQADV